MIKRAKNLNRHAVEISFPGGMFEVEDADLLTTALRETREELRMDIASALVIGRLCPVTTAVGVEVAPFLAVVEDLPPYEGNMDEVALTLEIPLAPLLATEQLSSDHKPDMFEFHFGEHRIWGASAKILRQVGQLAIFV